MVAVVQINMKKMWPYVFSNALLHRAVYNKLETIDVWLHFNDLKLIRESVDHIAVILHHILCGNCSFFAVACTLLFKKKKKFHVVPCYATLCISLESSQQGVMRWPMITWPRSQAEPNCDDPCPYTSGADITVTWLAQRVWSCGWQETRCYF